MKKSSIVIGSILLVIVATFYLNMYFNGTFNEVLIHEKKVSKHILQGKWLEGSFSIKTDEEHFFEFQEYLIETLKKEKVSVFYSLNPTNENHNKYVAFIGFECELNSPLIADSFKILEIELPLVLVGEQKCSPGYQRIHSELQENAEKNHLILAKDSIYEQFSKEYFYVEMKIDKKNKSSK